MPRHRRSDCEAQKMLHTSGQPLTAPITLIGNPPVIMIRNVCPADTFCRFSTASFTIEGSLPLRRFNRSPDAFSTFARHDPIFG